MKRKLKKVLVLILCCVLIFEMQPVYAVDAATGDGSGSYAGADNNQLKWMICNSGLFILEGTGDYTYSKDRNLGWWGEASYIKSAQIDVTGITSTSKMFENQTSLKKADISGLDTSQVKDMSSMFYACNVLENMDFTEFNTSNVMNMSKMFMGCKGMTELELNSFDTSKVTNMSYMFQNDVNLTRINVSSFNTMQVTDMRYMFYGCKAVETLDLSRFNTSNVTNMSSMFSGCTALKELNLSNFDFSKVTNIANFILNCSNLEKITMPGSSLPGDITLPTVAGYYWTNESGQEVTKIAPTDLVNGGQCYTRVKMAAVEPDSISLIKRTVLKPGNSKSLELTVEPSYAESNYVWTSSDESVATVDSNGNVTGKKMGFATITVTSGNGKTASCILTVADTGYVQACNDGKELDWIIDDRLVYVAGKGDFTGIDWKITDNNIQYFDFQKYDFNTAPATPGLFSRYENLIWLIVPPNISTSISLPQSEDYIWKNDADAREGYEIYTNVPSDVKYTKKTYEYADKVTIDPNNLLMTVGEIFSGFKVTMSPAPTDSTLTWQSSDNEVVVSEGYKITARKNGIAVVKVATTNNVTADCIVKVKGTGGAEGTDGTLEWLVDENNTLYVLGSGDFANGSWRTNYASKIKTIDLRKFDFSNAAITNDFLTSYPNLEKVIVPSNVKADIALPNKQNYIWTNDRGLTEGFKVYGNVPNVVTYTLKTYMAPETVAFSPSTIFMSVGKTEYLNLVTTPANAYLQNLTWTSSDNNIATVTDGKVTAKAQGTATITVQTVNGKSAKCTIEVLGANDVGGTDGSLRWILYNGEKLVVSGSGDFANGSWKLNYASAIKTIDFQNFTIGTVADKDSFFAGYPNLETVIMPANVNTDISLPTAANFIWTNNAGYSEGYTVIKNQARVITYEKKTVIPVEVITISENGFLLKMGDTKQLSAWIYPNNATDQSIIWTSSDTSIATVTNGIVTPVSKGCANITASTKNGKSATCKVRVIGKNDIAELGETMDWVLEEDGTLLVIGTGNFIQGSWKQQYASNIKTIDLRDYKVDAYVDEAKPVFFAGYPNVTKIVMPKMVPTGLFLPDYELVNWTNDGGLAPSNYVYTGQNQIITYTKDPFVFEEAVTLSKESIILSLGKTTTLKADIVPSNATFKELTWTSSDTNVATVKDGLITPVTEGSTDITVTTKNGKTATCKVKIIGTEDIGGIEGTTEWLIDKEGTLTVTGSGDFVSGSWKQQHGYKVNTIHLQNYIITNVENADSFFAGYPNLEKVIMPANVNFSISLPKSDSYNWNNTAGKEAGYTVYTGISQNITYTKNEFIFANEVTLSESCCIMKAKTTKTLTATVSPSNVTFTGFDWKSSNTAVATVTNGTIQALKAGTTDITVTTADGRVSATCMVKVIGEDEEAGTNGDMEWHLKADGTLVVSGNGDFATGGWKTYSSRIKTIDLRNYTIGAVTNGITYFAEYTNLTKVIMPANVTANISLPKSNSYNWTNDAGKAAGYTVYTGISQIVTYTKNEFIFADTITLSQDKLLLNVGKTEQITATITPDNVTYPTLTWMSSDNAVATVDNGTVTAVKEGTARITVRTTNGLEASCEVEVISSGSIAGEDGGKWILNTDGTLVVSGSGDFTNGGWKTYASSVKVIDLQNYMINYVSNADTFFAPYTNLEKVIMPANIWANISLPKSDSYNWTNDAGLAAGYTVYTGQTNSITYAKNKFILAERVNLSKDKIFLNVGNTDILTAKIEPSNVTGKNLTWTSSDSTVATVNNGTVSALKEGMTIITVKTDNNKSATCMVKVIGANDIAGADGELEWIIDENGIFAADGNGDFANGSWKEHASEIKVMDLRNYDFGSTTDTNDFFAAYPNLEKVIMPSMLEQEISLPKSDDFIWGNDVEKEAGYVAYAGISKIATYMKKMHIYAESITITPDKLSIDVGKQYLLKADIRPENVTFKELTWTSSDSDVAAVKDGLVIALSEGTVTITVEVQKGKKATCEVVVTDPNKPTEPTDPPTEVPTEKPTETPTEKPTEKPTETPTEKPTEKPTETPTEKPTEKPTETPTEKPTEKPTETPTEKPTETPTEEPTEATTEVSTEKTEENPIPSKTVGQKALKLTATKFPLQKGKSTTVLKLKSYAKGDSVAKWSSSNKKIATVSSKGKVTAKKTGKATITVTMKSGAKAKCKVTVQKGKVITKKLKLNKKSMTLKVRKKVTLKVSRDPITATEKIKWTSSNKKVATVSSKGKVTAKKKGKTTITARSSNGKKVTCKVTVKK